MTKLPDDFKELLARSSVGQAVEELERKRKAKRAAQKVLDREKVPTFSDFEAGERARGRR